MFMSSMHLCHVHVNPPRQQCHIPMACSCPQCTKTAVLYSCGMFLSSMHQDSSAIYLWHVHVVNAPGRLLYLWHVHVVNAQDYSAISVACSCRQCTRTTVLYLWHVHVVNVPGGQCYTFGMFMSSVHQDDSAIPAACSCRQCTRTTVLYLWHVHVVNAPGRQCCTCGMFMSSMH